MEVLVRVKPSKVGNYRAMQAKATKAFRSLYRFSEAESYGLVDSSEEEWTYKFVITEAL